jgi:hypothetical protein
MENPLTSPTGVPGFLLWLIGALLSGGGLGLWAGRRKRAADAASVNAETAIKLLTAIEANYEILHVRYSEEVERNKRLAAENHQLAAAQVDYDDMRGRLAVYERLDKGPTLQGRQLPPAREHE